LLRGEREPLTGLHGELMGMIVLPYLGPAAARREQAAPAPSAISGSTAGEGRTGDPLADLPMRLTYRTALVLEALADCPGASNRLVGERSGVADQGQISRLLARLQRLGLAQNAGEGRSHLHGEANAWRLTPRGEEVQQVTCVAGGSTDNGPSRGSRGGERKGRAA
jgi:hypothetical protein